MRRTPLTTTPRRQQRQRSLACCRGWCVREQDEDATPSLLEFFRRKLGRLSEAERRRFALSEDVMFDGLEDIIRAGTESSSLVVQWMLLYLAAFPDVQVAIGGSVAEWLA